MKDIYDDLIAVSALGEPTKRPSVRAKFKDREVVMLYDTGSSITCMNSDLFDRLSTSDIIKMRDVGTDVVFSSASGDPITARRRPIIRFELLNRTVEYPVYVVDRLHEQFILGIDFLVDENLGYCPKHREFYWSGNCPREHVAAIGLKEITTIPALGRRCCKIKVANPTLAGKTVIASVNVSGQPWIRGGPVLTKVDEHGDAWVEIYNASPITREINKWERVGQIEEIEMICRLEDVLTGGCDAVTPPRPATEVDRKFIMENAKIECPPAERQAYLKIFEEYHEIFSKHKNDLGRCDLIQHEIHLKDKAPVYIKQFKIPEGHATAVEEQVKEWLKLGIVQPSLSRFNSPIFVVKKKDGAFRLVQDFRALNAQTYPDKYSMRDVTDCIHEIGRANSTLFTTIDLTSGFWQMVLKPECREYTAFTVYGMGQFEFRTSPMGLLGCPASFQRLMELAMKDIPNVLVYIDDILVHSRTHTEHRETLKKVFERLRMHNLKIRLEKCHFANTSVDYLGFRLTPEGVLPGTDKTQVIRDAQPPDSVQKVRQFLGLCNFFRSHIKDFALRSHPLTVLTRKDCDWKGGPLPEEAQRAFVELKTALTSSPLVAFPRKDRQYALITDASCGDAIHPGGMGAILTQVDDKLNFFVIAYASRKLLKHEKNYTPFLLEMHAAVWGMEYFSHHLKGRRFLLFTDHKPMENLGKVHTKTLYRIQEAMMHYDFEIHYQKGAEMPADYLSRNLASIHDLIPDGVVATAQQGDPSLKAILAYLKHGTVPPDKTERHLITRYAHKCFIDKDLLWIRLYDQNLGTRSLIMVPDSLRHRLISQFHNSWFGGHEGIHKTIQRMQLYYFWPNMQTDVANIIKSCERCQKRTTIPATPPSTLQPLPILSDPNQRVHADLFGPLRTSSSGKKFILVITDAFTRYVELVAIDNKEAEVVAEAIFNNWICRFGVPAQLVTDQGKEFVAKVCQQIWKKLDMLHITTSARHPQANAQAEVVNKTIARYLASFVDETTLDWEPFLAPLMFSYNTAYHRSIRTSPFFLTYGIHPTMPNELSSPQYASDLPTDIMSRLQIARNIARQFMEDASATYKQQFDKHAVAKVFAKGQPVLLDEHSFLGKNAKLAQKFSGPHLITRLVGSNNVELLLANGKNMVVHVNRVKPFRTPEQMSSHPPNLSQNRGGVVQHQSDAQDDQQDEQITSAPRSERRITRSVTAKRGMIFNDQLKQFLDTNPIENVEPIRRIINKPRRKTQVKYIPYIEIQDYVDNSWADIKEEVKDESKDEPKDEDKDNDFVLGEDFNIESEHPSLDWDSNYDFTPDNTPTLRLKKLVFNDTPIFHQYEADPEEEYYQSETPDPFPTSYRPNRQTVQYLPTFDTGYTPVKSRGLLRDTLDGTAKFLFGDTDDTEDDASDPHAAQGASDGPSPTIGPDHRRGRIRRDHSGAEISTRGSRTSSPDSPERGPEGMGTPSQGHAEDRGRVLRSGSPRHERRSPSRAESRTYETRSRGTSRTGPEGEAPMVPVQAQPQPPDPPEALGPPPQAEGRRLSQFSRMATRGRPDWIREPYSLSHWFAKGAGFNEPAELRVLASRYLTDVSEINNRLEGQPPDAAVINELERRRRFLVREFKRTGTRYPGFPM